MRHFASADFWEAYHELPKEIQDLADRNFELLKRDPRHPSLHFKKVGGYYTARVGLRYRAVAVEVPEGFLWFWIGAHSEYDRIIE